MVRVRRSGARSRRRLISAWHSTGGIRFGSRNWKISETRSGLRKVICQRCFTPVIVLLRMPMLTPL